MPLPKRSIPAIFSRSSPLSFWRTIPPSEQSFFRAFFKSFSIPLPSLPSRLPFPSCAPSLNSCASSFRSFSSCAESEKFPAQYFPSFSSHLSILQPPIPSEALSAPLAQLRAHLIVCSSRHKSHLMIFPSLFFKIAPYPHAETHFPQLSHFP